ncbi:MAG: hypothetical protein LBR17_09120 [Bacteroidales bacterium]|jgi:hypothetical protein|nr:hypothetical protein [Bacteroidales bacterium]
MERNCAYNTNIADVFSVFRQSVDALRIDGVLVSGNTSYFTAVSACFSYFNLFITCMTRCISPVCLCGSLFFNKIIKNKAYDQKKHIKNGQG